MIGTKIRQYRLFKRLSLDELSQRLLGKITKMTLSKYERGVITPSNQNIFLIADALDIPVEVLLVPSPFSLNLLSFRKKSTLSKRRQDEIKAKLSLNSEKLLNLFEMMSPDFFSHHNGIEKISVATMDDVEEAAMQLRSRWNLGAQPIHNLTSVLENQNILVLFEDHETEFDGFSAEAIIANTNYKTGIIVCQQNAPGDRQRFSMAHELGHLILEIADDSLDEEKAVNRFASSFLLPRDMIFQRVGQKRNLVTYSELKNYKKEFGVSIQAIIYRLKDLSVISTAHYTEWFQYLTFSGLRIKEEIILESEKSDRITELIVRALTEGYIDSQTAVEEYGMESEFAESLDSRTKYFNYELAEKGGKNE
ncbi:XRE family transcriptional regulator [Ignavibacteriales bacterium]